MYQRLHERYGNDHNIPIGENIWSLWNYTSILVSERTRIRFLKGRALQEPQKISNAVVAGRKLKHPPRHTVFFTGCCCIDLKLGLLAGWLTGSKYSRSFSHQLIIRNPACLFALCNSDYTIRHCSWSILGCIHAHHSPNASTIFTQMYNISNKCNTTK